MEKSTFNFYTNHYKNGIIYILERMKIFKGLFFSGLLLVAFISNAQKPRYIKTETYEGVVDTKPITKSEIKKVAQLYVPTDGEIARMEKKIANSIVKLVKDYMTHGYADKNCDIVKNLPKYKRYYFGVYFRGENVIFTHFYKYLPQNWKTKMPIIRGNGLCDNFDLEYIVRKDSLIGLFPGEE